MRFRSAMIFALSLVLAGCAAGAAGPVTSPTGKTYAPGTRPDESEFSQRAILFLAQEAYDRALQEAQQGIAADSANPIHYYIAGQAQVGLGDYAAAQEMFDRAEEIYPAYELEVEPTREQAWVDAFNAGIQAYNAGNLEEAAQWWERANLIYPVRSEAYLNLAVIYTQQNEYEKAIEAYRGGLEALERTPATREFSPEEVTEREEARATMTQNLAELLTFTEQFAEAERLYRSQLETDPENVKLQSSLALVIARQGREAEAQEIYGRLLSNPALSPEELFEIGVALFNAKSYPQAADAFRRVTERIPNSRDAWYNYANALYAQEEFAALVPAAERLVQLDPLNENSALILARAYRETEENRKALAALERAGALPVFLENLQMQPREGRTTVRGTVIGNEATAGTPVQLRFTFYGANGQLGTQTVTVDAPAPEATGTFEAVFENPERAVAYSYEVVG